MSTRDEFTQRLQSYTCAGTVIPGYMIEPLTRYLADHSPVGGFLTAVLKNDLMEACGRADDNNISALPAYAGFLYNYAPMECYGSPEKVRAWIEAGEDERRKLEGE